MFVAIPLNREQIICMFGIYAHGGEPGDKATLMCVCPLVLLDPSVFARVKCVHAYVHGNCNVPIVITVHVHTQGERRRV